MDVLEHLLAPAFHVQTVLQTHGYRGVAALRRVLACHVRIVALAKCLQGVQADLVQTVAHVFDAPMVNTARVGSQGYAQNANLENTVIIWYHHVHTVLQENTTQEQGQVLVLVVSGEHSPQHWAQ